MSEQFPQFDDPKAAAKAAKAYAKATRPFYKKKRVIAPVALVAVVGLVQAGGGSDSTPATAVPVAAAAPAAEAPADTAPAAVPAETQDDAAKNVTIDACKVDDVMGGFATVGYTILNPTSKSSLYTLDFKVIDSTGAAVGTANGIEDNVLPDRPSKGEAVGTISDSAVAPFTCEIGDITRTESLS